MFHVCTEKSTQSIERLSLRVDINNHLHIYLPDQLRTIDLIHLILSLSSCYCNSTVYYFETDKFEVDKIDMHYIESIVFHSYVEHHDLETHLERETNLEDLLLKIDIGKGLRDSEF